MIELTEKELEFIYTCAQHDTFFYFKRALVEERKMIKIKKSAEEELRGELTILKEQVKTYPQLHLSVINLELLIDIFKKEITGKEEV